MNPQDVQSFPLVGSIQNSVGMGFLGNQAVCAVAGALGARVVHAPSQFSNAHGGVGGRSTTTADPAQFRRDVAFVVAQQPGIIVVGFLPRPEHVEVVVSQLIDFKGIVLLDPVIGDMHKGLFVSEETARAIRDRLLPIAQVVTPNRFEAGVLLGEADVSEHKYLNGLYDLGPESVIITSFERDATKQTTTSLFTNGYGYYRITGPYFSMFAGHGAGDIFAAGLATLLCLGSSQLAATLIATALCTRAVANTTTYGGASADPIAALDKWKPLGYHIEDDRAMRFCEKSGVSCQPIKPNLDDGPRLKFAPPKFKTIYG